MTNSYAASLDLDRNWRNQSARLSIKRRQAGNVGTRRIYIVRAAGDVAVPLDMGFIPPHDLGQQPLVNVFHRVSTLAVINPFR